MTTTTRLLLSLALVLGLGGFFGCASGGSDTKGASALLSNDKDDDADGEVDEGDEGEEDEDADEEDEDEADEEDEDEGAAGESAEEDGEEDEGEEDKIFCAADTDCDADETCIEGLCTGHEDPCSADTDCEDGEICRNGNCEDPI